jgi:propanol-preferring alcohol dehydrogenase
MADPLQFSFILLILKIIRKLNMEAHVIEYQDKMEDYPLKKVDVLKPIPKSHEIRIKITNCGVCHTDLHEVEGDLVLSNLPRIPGHEIVGIVDVIGDKVKTHQVGDRVGVAWLYSTCGNCKFCKNGLENLCENARFTGYSVDGGYAEYICIEESYAYPIPDVFSSEHAAPLMCAGVIGYRSIHKVGLHPKETLGLYGFGASAHIIIQVAKYWDCEIYVFTRSKNHQNHAKKLGATWIGSPQKNSPIKLDRIITFAPVGEIIPHALKNLEKGGRLAINAVSLTDIPSLSYEKIYYERELVSVAHTTRQDAQDFLKIAAEIPIHTDVVSYPFDNANQALLDLKHSKFNGAAVLDIK